MSPDQENLLPVTVGDSEEDVSAYTRPSLGQSGGQFIALWALLVPALVLERFFLAFKNQTAWSAIPNSGTEMEPIDTFIASYVILAMWAVVTLLGVFIVERSYKFKERSQSDIGTRFIGSGIFGIVFVVLLWYIVTPETCTGTELKTVLHIPHSRVLPITAEVAFPGSSATLTFAFAKNELGIAHENNTLRIAYDFNNGLALANASTVHATFSDASMQLSLPPPRDDLFFVPYTSGDVVRDASLFGAGEAIVRFVDRPKGHVCLARFDSANPEDVARVAFPLGLVMHSARLKNLWSVAA